MGTPSIASTKASVLDRPAVGRLTVDGSAPLDRHRARRRLTRFEQSVVGRAARRWTDAAGPAARRSPGSRSTPPTTPTSPSTPCCAGRAVARRRGATSSASAAVAAAVGLGEAEQPELTAALDLEPLVTYGAPCTTGAADWLGDLDATTLDARRRRRRRARRRRRRRGRRAVAVPRCGAAKPAAWFVQWEAIGHRVNHLGEMVVRPQPPRPLARSDRPERAGQSGSASARLVERVAGPGRRGGCRCGRSRRATGASATRSRRRTRAPTPRRP